MSSSRIPKVEYERRIERILKEMTEMDVDLLLVYGDEYRKENLRYVSNYWPIFERGGVFISPNSDPILLCAPECEKVAGEMSVWSDIRIIKDFSCVTVPDEIDYPLAKYSSFTKIANEFSIKSYVSRLGVIGLDAMPANLVTAIRQAFGGIELVDCNCILFKLRMIKSPAEIICLKEAARQADLGFRVLMQNAVPGNTELFAAGAGEGAARAAGAEHIIFTLFGSGDRTNTIVGRPTNKVIMDGDMIMAALAVQYEGYVATAEVPFAAGKTSSDQRRIIDALIRAEAEGLKKLKPGVKMKEFVIAVRDHFRKEGLSQYDVYPPLHGCGCAEAESPYPDEKTEAVFLPGMTVNTDISLFGCPGGSNRIEEGFVITEDGAETMSPMVRKYCTDWLDGKI